MKKRGLGRGLDVLIKSRVVEPEQQAEIVSLDMDALTPNLNQPRHHFDQEALDELAASIKSQGLIQPILVRPLDEPGKYEIVAGERRWRACQRAGLHSIECIVRPMDEHESMAIALIENLQREDLNPMEEARALGRIKEHFEITQDALADKIGKSRPAVANSLRLLRLPDKVQGLLESGAISAGHARALLSLEDAEDMEKLSRTVVSKGLNVRATEDLIRKFKKADLTPRKLPRTGQTPPQDISSLMTSLGRQFTIRHSGTPDKGKIVLSYASPQEREAITTLLERMAKEQQS